jgi:enoyl-CoA hydratase/carnithine racemase
MNEVVLCDVKDGVADVRLNRPEKRNALDLSLLRALVATAEGLARRAEVRAVVLSGEGAGFCAGMDVALFASGGDVDVLLGQVEGAVGNLVQRAAWVWHELPLPVIAAVHGAAVGGGLQIALGADLRLVAPDARLAALEIRWALVPDMTGTWTLPRLVGPDVAKELAWTGRTVDGTEAVRLGLATRVSEDPRAEALALGADLARRSAGALAAIKSLIDGGPAGADLGGGRGLGQHLAAEAAAQKTALAGPDHAEAVASMVAGRTPVFVERTVATGTSPSSSD